MYILLLPGRQFFYEILHGKRGGVDLPKSSKTEEEFKSNEKSIDPGVNLEKLKFEVGQEMGIKPKQKNKN